MTVDEILTLNFARERLARDAESTHLAFRLLDAEFTLSDLRLIYESLTGRRASTSESNFWRLISSRWDLKATGGKRPGKGRPAALYRLSNTWDQHLELLRSRASRLELRMERTTLEGFRHTLVPRGSRRFPPRRPS